MYFDRAADADHRNKYVTIDLLKTCLRDVSKYQVKLRDIFDKLLKGTDKKPAEYFYLQAIFHFFMNDYDLGVKSLIKAYKNNENITDEIKVTLFILFFFLYSLYMYRV